MKISRSPYKLMRLFALSLTLMVALSFGTFHTIRTESVRTIDPFTTHSTILIADGQETHGDGHGGHGDGHGAGGQETHGGSGGGGKTHG